LFFIVINKISRIGLTMGKTTSKWVEKSEFNSS